MVYPSVCALDGAAVPIKKIYIVILRALNCGLITVRSPRSLRAITASMRKQLNRWHLAKNYYVEGK